MPHQHALIKPCSFKKDIVSLFDEVHNEVIYLAPSFPALQYLHSCCRRKRGLRYISLLGTDTYPTLGKGKSSTRKCRLGKGYMIYV